MSGHNSITTECKDTSTALDPEVEAAAAFLMSDDTAYEAEPDAARRVATLMLEAASRAAAVAAEQKRAADTKAAEEAETARRAANRAHRGRINGEALADIVLAMSNVDTGTASQAESIAKAIVTAIAKGEIRNVTIGY